jgi:hypothetical protein
VKAKDNRVGVRVEKNSTVAKGYVNYKHPKKDHGVSLGNKDIGKISYEKQGDIAAKFDLANVQAELRADSRHPKKDFGAAIGNNQFSVAASNNGPI